MVHKKLLLTALTASVLLCSHFAEAFEGRIEAALTQGGVAQSLRYTASSKFLRIEDLDTTQPHVVNIFDLEGGTLTLLFPHNHSYARMKAPSPEANFPAGFPTPPTLPSKFTSPAAAVVHPPQSPLSAPAVPTLPNGLPPGIGPQRGIAAGAPLEERPGAFPIPLIPPVPPMPPTPLPGGPSLPIAIPPVPHPPSMPVMPGAAPELQVTQETTNILGFPCVRCVLRERGVIMEIWATDKLFPFQPYRQRQPLRFGPRRIEDYWGELLQARKLFPLRAVLKFEDGPEQLRFEVTSVQPGKIEDQDAKLFQAPPDYHEVESPPF